MNNNDAERVVQRLSAVCKKYHDVCEWQPVYRQFRLKGWKSDAHIRLQFGREVAFSLYVMQKVKQQVRKEFKQRLTDGAKIGNLIVQYPIRERNKYTGVVIRFVSPVAPRDFLNSLDVISKQADILLEKLCEMQKDIMF